MVIDSSLLSNGITAQLVGKLIEKHEEEFGRLRRLYDYYKGEHHTIASRTKEGTGVANNKITANHAKYIVKMTQAYIAGNAFKYSETDGCNIEPIKDEYSKQNISAVDSKLVKYCGIYGRAYELIYRNKDGEPRSAALTPFESFVIYSNDVSKEPVLGVRYFKRLDLDGACLGIVAEAYDARNKYVFEANYDSYSSLVFVSSEEHYMMNVPIIEYENDEERQGDFEQIISIIDAYNTLMSDRVNDKEQFVDSFLFLRGCEITTAQAEKLKKERILMGDDENAEAKYLYNVMTENDIKVLRDDLKEDIHKLSMVPDLSDVSFGNNLSGVAIRYKLLCFEQLVKSKEKMLEISLKQRFKIYNDYLVLRKKMELVHLDKIEVKFTHNLPNNNLEISQMLGNLGTLVSSKTKLEQLDFVSDAEEENELAKAEYEQLQKQMSEVYTDTVKTSVSDEEAE